MTDNVRHLPPSSNFTPDQALQSAKDMGLQDVLILGYDKDGHFFTRSSCITKAEGVFLLELARDHVMGR